MATLSEDLILLAAMEDNNELSAISEPTAAETVMAEDLKKINWQRLICFAIPIYNLIAPMSGMPPLPVPAFCSTPSADA